MLIGLLATAPMPEPAAELTPEAAREYDRYVQLTEREMKLNLSPGGTFLWADGLPEPRRSEVYARLRKGEVVATKMHPPGPAGEIATPGALLIDWVATIFIPGASMQEVMYVVQDHEHHSQYYKPEIIQSKTLEHSGGDYKIFYRIRKKKILTVVLDTEYEVHIRSLDSTHVYTDAYSTRIAQVENAGEPAERILPPGKDSGFLWRLNSYWRYFDDGSGVYVQCEAVALSRDIPMGLGWLIGPLAESVPKESLEFTLESTRVAVQHLQQHGTQTGD